MIKGATFSEIFKSADDDRLDGLFELCGLDNDCMCIYHEFDFWFLDFNVSFMYAYQLNIN
jgi:hypothetical protein